jgi:hypothetical protein
MNPEIIKDMEAIKKCESGFYNIIEIKRKKDTIEYKQCKEEHERLENIRLEKEVNKLLVLRNSSN